jgi:hypothetical protein
VLSSSILRPNGTCLLWLLLLQFVIKLVSLKVRQHVCQVAGAEEDVLQGFGMEGM